MTNLSYYHFLIINTKASPRIRFNKDGALLAVSTNDNGIKILANSDGLRLLRTFENLSFDGGASRTPEAAKVMFKINYNLICRRRIV